MRIRALCFDLDNTLWDVWPVIRRAEQAMYDYLVQRYPKITAAHTVETMRAARERTAALYPQMQHDFTFLRLQTLRDHALEFGYREAMAEEAFDVFIRARNEVDLYADVLPALAVLKPRYRLFTASNGNADLEKIGLAPYFERSLAARHVGALKPDPVMFRKVVEGTDLALHEVAYVGDDPHLDVEGARRAGMLTIWVNRTEASWPESIEPPDWTIRTLTELVQGLEADRG
jgi:putative hydrolase of the HAD superfamily